MTDREMLELAAKAYVSEEWRGNPHYMQGFMSRWNPRDDMGDALRLAVKCEIPIEFYDGMAIAGQGLDEVAEEQGTDPDAATRRAIFRVAVKIGRSMA